jgi:membrane protein YdbS with pleckstrin-like domain
MKNVQISSPETDRKIARPASIVFMSIAWLALVAALIWAFRYGHSDGSDWNAVEIIIVGILLAALVLIPIQLVRYFRQKQV